MKQHILIVEDELESGQLLKELLENQGFLVEHVLTSKEADQYMREHEQAPAVAILDLRLEGENETGAEIGKRLRRYYNQAPPEIIFYSAYDDKHFWREAVRLSIGIFLNKTQDGYKSVVTHTRALLIRREINLLFHLKLAILRNILRTRAPKIEIFAGLLESLFMPLFNEVLGLPYFFLLTVDGQTVCVSDNDHKLPRQHPELDALQQLVQANIPRQYLAGKELENTENVPWFDEINDALMMALYHHNAVQLTLGISKRKKKGRKEEPEKLAKALCRHLQPVWLDRIFSLMQMLIDEDLRRRESLDITARFCTVFGNLQEEFYSKAQRHHEIGEDAFILPRFQSLGQKMIEMGKTLSVLEGDQPDLVEVNLKSVAASVWEELVQLHGWPSTALYCPADIPVFGNEADLRITLQRIFTWLGDRFEHLPEGSEPLIRVDLESTNEKGVVCTIMDQSKRLPRETLDRLFHPFTDAMEFDDGMDAWLGLFLSKMLVESRLGGSLTEQSKQLTGEHGHRLELQLLAPQVGNANSREVAS